MLKLINIVYYTTYAQLDEVHETISPHYISIGSDCRYFGFAVNLLTDKFTAMTLIQPRFALAGMLVSVCFLLIGCAVQPILQSSQSQVVPQYPIAYLHEQRLWLADHNNHDATPLTPMNASITTAAWMPQAKAIVYSMQRDHFYELWVQNVSSHQAVFIIATTAIPEQITISSNGNYLLYIAAGDLYFVDLNSKIQQRVASDVTQLAWSTSSKQFAYVLTSGQLNIQTLGPKGKLPDPLLLSMQAVSAPLFLDNQTLAFEGSWENQYAILTMDLSTQKIQPLTSLRFPHLSSNSSLVLQSQAKLLLYSRDDSVWVFSRSGDQPQLILTKSINTIWGSAPNELYYLTKTTEAQSEPDLYQASAKGFNITKIGSATAVITPAQLQSNDSLTQL